MKIFRTGAYETFYDMPLEVNWDLTKVCNYRCSYCFRYGEGKNPPPPMRFATLAQLRAAVNNIAALNRPWYDIVLSGGEPTLHPHILDLISLLQETLGNRINKIGIISNGSRNETFYKKIADDAKLINFLLNISIHTDYLDMPHILELIENLANDTNLVFSLMFNPAKREEVHLIYDILFEYRKMFPFNVKVIIIRDGDRVDPRYTQEDFVWQQKSMNQFEALANEVAAKFPHKRKIPHSVQIFHDIENNGERKIVENTNNKYVNFTNGLSEFKGMYCIAHAAILRIEEGGACRGLVCGADPHICNIYEENSLAKVREKLIYAVQCPLRLCGCSSNDRVPKFSSRQEALRFIQISRAKQAALFNVKPNESVALKAAVR